MSAGKHIFVIGLPRSGTSWVGAVLGGSESIGYLREPITEKWLSDGLRNTSVDPRSNEEYAALVEGVLGSRQPSVVKEVNTFLVPYLADRPNARIVLLHRHPCAVALSHWERKWRRLEMEKLFGEQESGDFWFDHGRLQALLMREAATVARKKGHVVSYDALTRDPHTRYERLASEIDVEWDEAARSHLASTLGQGRPTDPYSISRDVTIARDRWIKKLDDRDRDAVLSGYRTVKVPGLPRPTATGYQSRKLMYWSGRR